MVQLYRVGGSLASLSMLGSFLIVVTYIMMPDLRQHPTNLVFFLSISDFFFSLKFFVTSVWKHSTNLQEDSGFCMFQSIFSQFFGLASISWNGIISFNLLLNLRNPFSATSSLSKFYHMFVWTLCSSTTIIMLLTHNYGKSGDGTCWIKNSAYRLTFFIPLLVYFIISITSLTLAILRTRSITEVGQRRNSNADGVENEVHGIRQGVMFRMGLYTVAFILFWSFPLIHRLDQYIRKLHNNTHDPEYLQYLDIIGSTTQGFANACLWLTNPSFFRSLRTRVLPKLNIGTDPERLPLIPNSIQNHLKDSNQDIQRIDIVLRKYLISYIVQGIKSSVSGIISSMEHTLPVTLQDYQEKRILAAKSVGEDAMGAGWKFVDYAPVVFSKLRELCGISPQDYLKSLEPSKFMANLENQKFSDGRSGSFFVFSPDKKFILKTVPTGEGMLLLRILPDLYEYLSNHPDSMIIKFYGLHVIHTPHGDSVCVVVLENVFNTTKSIHEKYDLKGSWINRKVKAHDVNPSVLGMDSDLKRKLKLHPYLKEKFLEQLALDAQFFANLNIMDYSLLLGIHFLDRSDEKLIDSQTTPSPSSEDGNNNNTITGSTSIFRKCEGGMLSSDGTELYFAGVIDVLQLYDAQKKRERFVKVYLLHKDKDGISVQEPQLYAERFIKGTSNIVE